MNSKWSHKFSATKPYTGAGYRPGSTITVEAGLHQIGNQRPYFSVTGSIKEPGQRDSATSGAIHEDIIVHWPELAPVIHLHLSNDVGTPMHVEANGWYALAGYFGGAGEQYHAGNGMTHHSDGYRVPTAEECLARFAEHVRVTLDEARTLAHDWRNRTPDLLRLGGRALMAAWIEEQAPRWKAEADAAVALLDSLIGDGRQDARPRYSAAMSRRAVRGLRAAPITRDDAAALAHCVAAARSDHDAYDYPADDYGSAEDADAAMRRAEARITRAEAIVERAEAIVERLEPDRDAARAWAEAVACADCDASDPDGDPCDVCACDPCECCDDCARSRGPAHAYPCRCDHPTA